MDSNSAHSVHIYESRKAQAKDSEDIELERVKLLKTIKNQKEKLLIFGYVRENTTSASYKLDIPSSVIEYIVLYRWYLNEWERMKAMEEAMRKAAEEEERKKRQEIERKNKEIDDQ